MIPARLEIRNNKTGEVRASQEGWDWDGDTEYPDYIWSEGNYACDCNRALFFARVVGEDDPDRNCGDSAFAVRLTAEDGTVLYEDFTE